MKQGFINAYRCKMTTIAALNVCSHVFDEPTNYLMPSVNHSQVQDRISFTNDTYTLHRVRKVNVQ